MTAGKPAPLVVITGKGGVGKTTVATATAQRAAQAGRRVLLAETAVEPGHERQVGGVDRIAVTPQGALEEYLAAHLPLRPFAVLLPRTMLFRVLTTAAPGLGELLTIGRLWELSRGDRYDVVVVDGPATGHALALLQAPAAFGAAVGGGPVADPSGGARHRAIPPQRSPAHP